MYTYATITIEIAYIKALASNFGNNYINSVYMVYGCMDMWIYGCVGIGLYMQYIHPYTHT